MGTNYYRIKEIPKEKRKKLHNLLDDVLNNRCQSIELENAVKDIEEEHYTHICKSSCGWQVCFDHNWGKYYQPNRKSLEAFLSEEGTYIENEYGDKLSYEDFWDMVEKHNSNPHNSWTSKSYEEYERNNGRTYPKYCSEVIEKCKQAFGIDSNGETDFTVDGLRFAVYSDFC